MKQEPVRFVVNGFGLGVTAIVIAGIVNINGLIGNIRLLFGAC